MSVWSDTVLSTYSPTAQVAAADGAVTAYRSPPLPPLKVVMCRQALPFQANMTVAPDELVPAASAEQLGPAAIASISTLAPPTAPRAGAEHALAATPLVRGPDSVAAPAAVAVAVARTSDPAARAVPTAVVRREPGAAVGIH